MFYFEAQYLNQHLHVKRPAFFPFSNVLNNPALHSLNVVTRFDTLQLVVLLITDIGKTLALLVSL